MNIVRRYGVVIEPGAEVELTVETMSHLEEEAGAGGLDSNENMSAEDNGGTERTSLMVDKEVSST